MTRAVLLGLILGIATGPAIAETPFAIEVVDSQTGRGVPLVELRTVNEIRFVTDSRGIVAFDEPGLIGLEVFFHVKSHGYELDRDGFGFRGKALRIVPGGRGRIEIRRINIAQRLYRVTGAGIYRDSVLVGDRPPIREPLLNARVLGSDSVQNAVFQGQIHWFWGDTNRPGYPLGNFQTPTARSLRPLDGGLDIEAGVNLDYATDANGFAAPSAPIPGEGPTWIDGLTVLKDRSGNERMFAAFAKIRPPLEVAGRGLAEFQAGTRTFTPIVSIPKDAPVIPSGHSFPHRVRGVDYVYYADPYPLVRVRAEVEALTDLDQFEAFTCLRADGSVDRSPDGSPRYAWRRGCRPLTAEEQTRRVKAGTIRPEECLLPLQDVATGRPIVAHRGSVAWNEFRSRWVLITVEIGGESSHLGEVWFAEAETPLGPWVYARKIVTHDRYSFYNPKQHPIFARDGGRRIFFEGTYATTFSGNPDPTPRYDYNQIMYKLDLDDPRLNLPVAIRPVDLKPGQPIPFFALEHPGIGTIPIGNPVRFHALPWDAPQPPTNTTILYESTTGPGGSAAYTTDPDRSGRAVGRVWRNPTRLRLPDE